MMSLAFSETTSVRHLQNSIEFFGHYLAIGQTALIWVTHHPYWAVAIAILTLTLIQTILGMTSEALRRGLRWLIQLPWRVLHWSVRYGFQSGHRFWMQPTTQPSVDEQITAILQKLEVLRQEQDTLIKDLKTLLATK